MTQDKDQNLKVGIVITTMNRSDFMIRQLSYYDRAGSPHPVYVGDASNDEESKKLKDFIEKIENRLTIFYYHYPKPEYSLTETVVDLYNKVTEKYCVFSGDDDYQIPNSITKCAEFLENNDDYSNASGYAVSFRLKNNGVYGELDRLADYPRRQIEHSSASKRLIDFMSQYYVPLFSVHRTEQIRKCWLHAKSLENLSFSSEILPSAMSLILGKSKTVDYLSFIRQIHNRNLVIPDTFDWMMGKEWHSSFENFIKILTEEIASKDNAEKDEAYKTVKRACWKYISRRLSREYESNYTEPDSGQKIKQIKSLLKAVKLKVGQKLPWLKNIYRSQIRPLTKASAQIHDEVIREGSKYYDDFRLVMDSFTSR